MKIVLFRDRENAVPDEPVKQYFKQGKATKPTVKQYLKRPAPEPTTAPVKVPSSAIQTSYDNEVPAGKPLPWGPPGTPRPGQPKVAIRDDQDLDEVSSKGYQSLG